MSKIRAMAQGEMARRLLLPGTLSVVRQTGKEEGGRVRKQEEMEEHACDWKEGGVKIMGKKGEEVTELELFCKLG